jgi:hypothetical protein
MQPPRFCHRLSFLIAALIAAESGNAFGQQNSAAPSAGIPGVRHQIHASVRADRAFYGQRGGSLPDHATVVARILVSDNSQEFHFFGEVSAKFSEFAPLDGSPEQMIWEDAGCHHERGFPKFTVTAIEGQMTTEQAPLVVSAHIRQIGLLLPADEVTQGRRLFSGTDTTGAFSVTRVETRQSHLFLDLKLYTLRCELK